jgi:hypothetical protein
MSNNGASRWCRKSCDYRPSLLAFERTVTIARLTIISPFWRLCCLGSTCRSQSSEVCQSPDDDLALLRSIGQEENITYAGICRACSGQAIMK